MCVSVFLISAYVLTARHRRNVDMMAFKNLELVSSFVIFAFADNTR